MLVLSRKVKEKILIGDEIVITLVRVGPTSARIGIQAPREMNVVRAEIAVPDWGTLEVVRDPQHNEVSSCERVLNRLGVDGLNAPDLCRITDGR